MPYPNEHSARLYDPGRFSKKAWRRTKGGKLYGRIKVPSSISIIWGKYKGKDKPSDPVIPQALRFPKSSWTVQTAKNWLKKNNISYKKFEPAKSASKNESEQNIEKPGQLEFRINGLEVAIRTLGGS